MFGAYPIIMIVVSAAALFVAISAALWFSSGAETSQALPLTALTKSPTKLNCTDKHPTCEYDAQRGECESNPSWMIFNCPKACNACELLDTKIRCSRKRMNISDEPVYLPGDMDHMFREIIPRFQHAYDIEVLSESPWIVLFNNFLTDLEADAFIQTVNGRWQRSKAVASQQLNEFGAPPTAVSENRTSSQAWCQEGCREDWRIHSVIRKIEHVVGIPYSHYEDFQVLRYENGQYYKEHHDMGEFQLKLPSGPRILTFFMYLSDIEEGGETSFPRLGINVKPKRGSALLWPNTLSDDVLKQDPRTHHESVPVIRGTKYAANSWIHAYDFSASLIWGCTGSSREN